jgi:hypothetical protein
MSLALFAVPFASGGRFGQRAAHSYASAHAVGSLLLADADRRAKQLDAVLTQVGLTALAANLGGIAIYRRRTRARRQEVRN